MNLTDSYDKPQPIILDPNFLKNFNPFAPGQTVIGNVFGDTRTFDPVTQTWNMSQAQADKNAYDRFTSLNPPAVLPSFSGLTSGLMGSLLVLLLGLVVILKIIK